MNMKYWGLYWIISISLLFSCAGPTENEVIKVDFGRLDKDGDLFSKNVFDSVSYVFLESDTNCFVGNTAKLVIVDSNYYIHDRMGQLVCCFNSKGDFIKAIGKTGRGPGEYFQATDFVVDAATKHVEVLAPYSRRTYEYSSDGEFIGSKDDVIAYSFIKEANGNYWFSKGIAADPEIGDEQIYEKDSKGNIVRKYLPALHTLHAGILENNFSAAPGNSVLYYSLFNNRIYRITPDTIRPIMEFDFGTLAYPEDLFGRAPSEVVHILSNEDHLSIGQCLENQKYLYLCIAQTAVNFKYYHLLYNKETRKMLCREVERNSWEWSFFHDAKALTENNELIFIADPESYNDALERKNTVFYQSGTPIQDAEASNNLLVKLSINW